MTYQNAFADLFKNSFDFNQLFSTQRRNIEALSAANQAIVESAQEIMRREAEVVRSNVETVLKTSKDMFTGNSPETNVSRQAELTRNIFEDTLSTLRDIGEMATKASFEAFDVLNKRAAESLEELSQATGQSGSASKKKSAA